MPKLLNIIGNKYGAWTVTCDGGSMRTGSNRSLRLVVVRCICGHHFCKKLRDIIRLKRDITGCERCEPKRYLK